jgi:hypothetical protein
MATLLSLTEAKKTTTSAGQFDLGTVAAIFDSTYGAMKAIYCYFQDALTVSMAPVYPDVTAGWSTSFTVDEDENETGVVGQEYCIGACLSSAAVTTAFYGWVLVSGLSPLAMTTDGSVAAGGGIIGSTTDGTWSQVAATQAVDEGSTNTYTVVNNPGYVVATANAADSSTTLAAGGAQFNSVLSGLPVTLS